MGFRNKSHESNRSRGDPNRLPSASGNGSAHYYIVNMQVVVGIACGGFAVEGDAHRLASIAAQINADRLARGGVVDVVVNVFRTAVVPLAQDAPMGLVVGGD